MATTHPRQGPTRESPQNGIAHYRYLVSRHSWFLVIATPAAIVVAIAVALVAVPPKDPELTARTLIGIENREDMAPGQGTPKENLGREDLMLGRTFIREIVRTLSLQLVTGEKQRALYFDSAALDSTVPSGLYRVRCNRGTGTFSIVYFDTNTFRVPLVGVLPFVKGRTLVNNRPLSAGPIAVPGGLSIAFSKRILANPRSFDFSIVGIRLAVENVLRGLTIKRADPEHGINYVSVQMTGRDYEVIAATANEIARVFVEKNLSFRKRRSQSILAALEKQLALANNGQGNTSSALSSFKAGNPLIGITSQAEQSAANLAQLDTKIRATQQTLSEAEGLGAAFSGAHGDEKIRIAAAMLETMSQNKVAAAVPLRDALQQLVVEQRTYAENYDERHPLRLENARKLESAVAETAALFSSFIGTLHGSVTTQSASKNAIAQELNRLPSEEVQLGRLQRKQQVISDVYSAILERYNQAKIADAVEAADFYIMDAAVPPMPPPQDRSQTLIFALLIGLALPAAYLVLNDRLTATVYTKTALNEIFNVPVLEAIPYFRNLQQAGKRTHTPRIDVPCRPPFMPELFDSMFMRLRLRWGEKPDAKVVAISGLETGGGKSTIAINLAIRIAQQGNRVLLVDSDMHRGRINDQFNITLSPGLSDVLLARDEAIISGPFSLIYKTGVPDLSIIAAGGEINNSFATLSSKRFAEFIKEWRNYFTYIIIDAAPFGVVPDAAAFCEMADSYIVVVNAGSTNTRALQERLEEFTQIKAKIAGFVLNRSDTREAMLYHRSYSRYHRKKDA